MAAQETSADAGLHAFLDDVSQHPLTKAQQQWLHLDVATMFASTPILDHEINTEREKTLLFLKESLVLLCANERIVHHFPRHLIHCFVDDQRGDDTANEHLFHAELFSISPLEEQLCWVADGHSEHEVPHLQAKVAQWMGWLNRV